MKVLLVDNYDSFTFNLYQLAADVFGEAPVVVRNNDSWEMVSAQKWDAAIISPGPGTPERDADFGISRRVLMEMDVPTLGVCLGHQGMCHMEGAPIIHAPQPMHGRVSSIFHNETGLFRGIPNPFEVVRYHSLVAPEPLPPMLTKTAWTEDGLLMGIEHNSRPMWGVQFHPESICTTYGAQLMTNFRDMAREFHQNRDRNWTDGAGGTEASDAGSTEERPVRQPKRLFVERVPLKLTALQIFERVFNGDPYAFWLDSSMVREPDARFSFMGSFADDQVDCIRYYASTETLDVQKGCRHDVSRQNLFTYLNQRIASVDITGPALPFDLNGGLVGYFGYELKAVCGARAAHQSPHPDCYLMEASRFAAVDHIENELYLVFIGDPNDEPTAAEWFRSVLAKTAAVPLSSAIPYRSEDSVRFVPTQTEEQYLSSIDQCLEAINDGETYEVCLTNCLTAETGVSPFEYYKRLRSRNPAPYASFFKFPELAIASSSPERFLRATADRIVESKPIKGTIRRGASEMEDQMLTRWLSQDEKSRAENLMIVDLLRNDLGRVCEVGSVCVPKLMHVETYATVHQLVSNVQGRLDKNRTVVDCLEAAFPGGSMTGAPKIRTMEIIDELETQARGIYSGSIGYLAFNGTADLNIVIRTTVFANGTATIGVGGAVVALSDPQEEWNEILLKARAPLATFEQVARSAELCLGPAKERGTEETYGDARKISKRVG